MSIISWLLLLLSAGSMDFYMLGQSNYSLNHKCYNCLLSLWPQWESLSDAKIYSWWVQRTWIYGLHTTRERTDQEIEETSRVMMLSWMLSLLRKRDQLKWVARQLHSPFSWTRGRRNLWKRKSLPLAILASPSSAFSTCNFSNSPTDLSPQETEWGNALRQSFLSR